MVGGVVLSNNIHVWMADTQTPKSHHDWLSTLATIQKLKPVTVVPGHFLPGKTKPTDAVEFTAGDIRTFDAETAKAKDSAGLVKAMATHYPQLGDTSSLEMSAKVAKGEMKW